MGTFPAKIFIICSFKFRKYQNLLLGESRTLRTASRRGSTREREGKKSRTKTKNQPDHSMTSISLLFSFLPQGWAGRDPRGEGRSAAAGAHGKGGGQARKEGRTVRKCNKIRKNKLFSHLVPFKQ